MKALAPCALVFLLVVACSSSKFNSREEASIAVDNYFQGGKEVVLVYVPSDKEVEEQ